MVDYVNEKYSTSWLFNNEVSDVILDDLLKRVYKNQQRVKDDKAIGNEIIDDVDKENVNVEVVLNKPKNNKLKGKGKHGTSSASFKGRKGSPSKKGSCSKSIKTKPWNVLNFFNDSSSDDHGSVFRDDHGSVFRGKPGSTSKGVGAAKHSKAKQSKGKRKMV
ncbi:hypothetical protein Tco_0226659 [Tanacetum coccineum]